MARVVCQVLVLPDRLTFIWSEGAASFEPYHLTGSARDSFLDLARQANEQLAEAAARGEPDGNLAATGQQLLRALFDPQGAREIKTWLDARPRGADTLEIVGDGADLLPWQILTDRPDDASASWGTRFALTAGRRVDPLRRQAILESPHVLFVVDSGARDALAADARKQLGQGFTVVESAEALAEAARTQPPDVLCLFCRVSGSEVHLGDRRFSGDALRGLLCGEDTAYPATLVVLAACAGDGPGDVAAVLRGLGARASVAAAAPLPAGTAASACGAFLEGFLRHGESPGVALRRLGPTRPLFQAHGPSNLRVDRGGASDTAVKAAGTPAPADDPELPPVPLPERPYRPLTPFDSEDRALFIGREDDTEAFAELLDGAGIRLALLHGGPGVGKASLLHAGVVPFLEEECVGYRAVRDRSESDGSETEDDYPVLASRATQDLAGQVALALLAWCARPYVYTTPAGRTVEVDLPGLLRGALAGGPEVATAIKEPGTVGSVTPSGATPPDPEALRLALRRDPDLLGRLLSAVAERLPHEPVLLIEQGEDMISLVRGESGRLRSARMLQRLARAPGRGRVVVSLRTEYHGRLLDQLHGSEAGLRSYLLRPLDDAALLDALLLPTSSEPAPGSDEVPAQKYGFTFEEGLAAGLARDLRDAGAAQQVSPVVLLQILAARILDAARARGEAVIRPADVARVGGVDGAMLSYIQELIRTLPVQSRDRAQIWPLLEGLCLHHADGTVTRDLRPLSKLSQEWRGASEFAEVATQLAAPEARLLEVTWLNVGGQQGDFVSLAHDGLAVALATQVEQQRRRQLGWSRVVDMLWIVVPLLVLAGVFAYTRQRAVWAVEARLEEENKAIEAVKKQMQRTALDMAATNWPLYVGAMNRAQQSYQTGDLVRARRLLQSQQARWRDRDAQEIDDLRGFEWFYLWRLVEGSRHTLLGHQAPLVAVAAAAEGKVLATGSEDGTARLWSGGGEILATLRGHKAAVHAVAVAPDGKWAVTGGADGSVKVWDVPEGGKYAAEAKPREEWSAHTGAVRAVAVSPDGKTVATAGADGAVKLWDAAAKDRGKPRAVLAEGKGAVLCLAYAPDGKTLAAAGEDAQVRLWDTGKEKVADTLKPAADRVTALAYSADGKSLAAGGVTSAEGFESGVVTVYDVGKGKESATARPAGAVFGVAFVADGKTLAIAGKDNAIGLWDAATGTPRDVLRGHVGWVKAIVATASGDLVTGSADATAKIWDPGAAARDVLAAHPGGAFAVAIGPPGEAPPEKDDKGEKNGKAPKKAAAPALLASGGADGTVKLWDSVTGKELKSLAGHKGAVLAVAFADDGKTLASGGADGTVRLWDTSDRAAKEFGSQLAVLKGHTAPVRAVAFGPKGREVASGGESIRIWDTSDRKNNFGKEIQELGKDGAAVRCLTFLPTTKDLPPLLLSGGADHLIRAWSYREGKEMAKLIGHTGEVTALTTMPDVPYFVVSGSADRTVRMWNLRGGKEEAQLRGHSGSVTAVAFPPRDQRTIASSGAEGSVRLWSPHAAERFALPASQGAVHALAFSQDGEVLATAGRDGTVRLWRAAPEGPGPAPHP